MPLTIYTLAHCDTCRKAVKWLRAQEIEFEEKAIRETPPSVAELRAMLGHQRGDLRRLCNTAGQEFRALQLKEKLPRLTTDEALRLLVTHGSLVKRPFLIGPKVGLVGFDEQAWAQALART